MKNERTDALIALAARVVDQAKRGGAEVAEAMAVEGAELSAKVRLSEPELIEEAGSRVLGLRVISGGKTGTTHTSDLTETGLRNLVEGALELAALSEPDPLSAPPDAGMLAKTFPELDLFDPEVGRVEAGYATELAKRGEDAARAFDPRITNSDGAGCARSRSAMALVTSGGFAGGYASTYLSLSVSPLADDAGGKKRTGHHWDARRHLSALADPEGIGEEAARKTLAKLGARKVETCEVPVVFDPDAGRALLSLFFSVVAGGAIYRRASYLCDREGDTVASPLVTIVDDPLMVRGPGSRPFDGEGLPSKKNVVVERGVLKSYLLDTYSARKLGRSSTHSAARAPGGRPMVAPTNFHLLAGDRDPKEIVKEVDRGLYVTSMMGFGFNAVTGDFSRGAEGFWIQDGELTFPVGEITISLGFDDLWKRVDAVGRDLDLKSKLAVPTFRVSRMTVAGT